MGCTEVRNWEPIPNESQIRKVFLSKPGRLRVRLLRDDEALDTPVLVVRLIGL